MTECPPADTLVLFTQQHTGPHYTATAYPFYHYWELAIDGIGVTQAAPGESHRNMILDYVHTLGHNTKNAHVLIYYPGHPTP